MNNKTEHPHLYAVPSDPEKGKRILPEDVQYHVQELLRTAQTSQDNREARTTALNKFYTWCVRQKNKCYAEETKRFFAPFNEAEGLVDAYKNGRITFEEMVRRIHTVFCAHNLVEDDHERRS